MSQFGQAFYAMKGVQDIDPFLFNPWGDRLYEQQAKQEVHPVAARTLLALTAENKVPSWAIAPINLRLIRAAAK